MADFSNSFSEKIPDSQIYRFSSTSLVAKEIEQFANCHINDPSTFQHLHFLAVVRFFRKEYDLTMKELANLVSLTRQTLGDLESKSLSDNSRQTRHAIRFVHSFGWERGDPRYEILRAAAEREKSRNS